MKCLILQSLVFRALAPLKLSDSSIPACWQVWRQLSSKFHKAPLKHELIQSKPDSWKIKLQSILQESLKKGILEHFFLSCPWTKPIWTNPAVNIHFSDHNITRIEVWLQNLPWQDKERSHLWAGSYYPSVYLEGEEQFCISTLTHKPGKTWSTRPTHASHSRQMESTKFETFTRNQPTCSKDCRRLSLSLVELLSLAGRDYFSRFHGSIQP